MNWDPDVVEREWLDAVAVLGELVPSVDEVAARFSSASFEATIEGDDRRLLRLAQEARDAALQGRVLASFFETFAEAVERRDAHLARAVIHALREAAEREFRYAHSDTEEETFRMDE